MSEIDPRETKGLPNAVSEEANAGKLAHNDPRRTEVRDEDSDEVETIDPDAEEANPPVKTEQTRG